MTHSTPEQPLDVAIAMFDFGPSGVVRNALRIAAAASAAGLRVELWVLQNEGTLRADVPDGIKVIAFGQPLGEKYSRAERRRAGQATLPALIALLRRRRPAVLLSAGNHFHSIAAAAIRRADVPTRLILRLSTGLPRPLSPLNPWGWARYAFKAWKAGRRHAAATRLVAVSREIADELVRDPGAERTTIDVIPNGIDRAEIARRAAEPLDHDWFAPGAPPVILGVGRIDRFKNFELLIEAFARLRPERELRLLILGEERTAWQHRLEALAERLGVAADVRFAGFVANPHPFFRAAAAYVCCSRYEGMSNAMLEAMANGCPVIATRTVTGAAELLDNGRLGPLVAPEPAALAAAIAERLDRPRNAAALQDQAAEYGLERTMRRYVDLLTEQSGHADPDPNSHVKVVAT